MTRRKGQELEAMKLLVRTRSDDDGTEWIVIFLAVEEPGAELARIRESVFRGSGDPLFHEWVDIVTRCHEQRLTKLLEENGIEGRFEFYRRKANRPPRGR